MKSTGFVPKDAGASVKKFLIYVTLPASIITNFSAIEDMGFNMLIIAALGILLNVIMIAVGATDHTQKIQRRTGVKYVFRHLTSGRSVCRLCRASFRLWEVLLPVCSM